MIRSVRQALRVELVDDQKKRRLSSSRLEQLPYTLSLQLCMQRVIC